MFETVSFHISGIQTLDVALNRISSREYIEYTSKVNRTEAKSLPSRIHFKFHSMSFEYSLALAVTSLYFDFESLIIVWTVGVFNEIRSGLEWIVLGKWKMKTNNALVQNGISMLV